MFRNDTTPCSQPRRASRISNNTSKTVSTLQLIRLITVIPSGQEFEWERRALFDEVISDVQQFAVQMGVDIELLEPTVEPTEDEEMSTAIELLKKPASYLMCFLGDKYGECALPMDMRETEFDAIRTSAFEASNDVRLLDKYYELDKTRNPAEYRLRRIAIEPTERRKLIEVIQRGAKQVNISTDAKKKTKEMYKRGKKMRLIEMRTKCIHS
uniref:DUF4062 domain-containing protein n=1 Tax=Ascaris lumbricoides TaxID=6252 RepID=A0A0M3IQB2_ASCLU